jgi:SAM-dependent methyltransferase
VDSEFFAAYAAVERTHWWFLARREIVLAMVERLVPAGGSVLDVGCGTGFVLERLRERFQASGLEPSPIALEECRKRGLDQVRPGSAEDLSAVAGRRFDAVLFLDVLEHLDDDVAALCRARDVLAPDGVVLVTVPAFRFLWSQHDVANQHRRRYTQPELEQLLRRSGFILERASYFNMYLFPLALAQRWTARALGSGAAAGLRVPPAPVNRLMRRIFESEKNLLVRARGHRGLPFGVSVLAVGRRAAG